MSRADAPSLRLPAVDDRLVAPDTRYEIWDGELVYVSPADPPHGTRHVQLAALVEAHTGLAFEVAADLLTRTSEIDDVAPDVSVYPDAAHPETGGRQLEQLAFEIVSTGSLGRAGAKAAKLIGRGVRRVFAIDVERSRALEWSATLGRWTELAPAGQIDDPALEVALPIEALIHAARADDAVARALLAKRNPVIEAARARDRTAGQIEGRAAGQIEGRAAGLAEAVRALLAVRGVSLRAADRARIDDERDPERLHRWLARAATCATVEQVLDEP
jgi:Uma2 family endonuclease